MKDESTAKVGLWHRFTGLFGWKSSGAPAGEGAPHDIASELDKARAQAIKYRDQDGAGREMGNVSGG